VTTAASTVVGRIDFDVQRQLVADLHAVRIAAPLFTPVAGSQEMSVKVTNAGPWGWCATDGRHKNARRLGYHYSDIHPETGRPWPSIPPRWLELADLFSGPDSDGPLLPWDCAHIVYYKAPRGHDRGANLGWHSDKTEHNRLGRIVTFVLGDDALWEIEDEDGNPSSTILHTGDVVRLSGPSRHLSHRIVKLLPREPPEPPEQTLDLFAPPPPPPPPSPLTGPGRVIISVRSGAGPMHA
jgi:alkylated DNA repair protein (DNA oxidative demethylase)